MVCQCGGIGKGIKSKVGGELDISLQALFTYLCDLCAFDYAISPLILLFFNTKGPTHPRFQPLQISQGSKQQLQMCNQRHKTQKGKKGKK
jgi:hypothetical protein